LERKNGKRKNPNVHVLQYFGLYNKYHLLDYKMNSALIIIGLAMFIFIIVFSLKRAKEKRKAQQEEHEKIKEYGENINEETRNKNK